MTSPSQIYATPMNDHQPSTLVALFLPYGVFTPQTLLYSDFEFLADSPYSIDDSKLSSPFTSSITPHLESSVKPSTGTCSPIALSAEADNQQEVIKKETLPLNWFDQVSVDLSEEELQPMTLDFETNARLQDYANVFSDEEFTESHICKEDYSRYRKEHYNHLKNEEKSTRSFNLMFPSESALVEPAHQLPFINSKFHPKKGRPTKVFGEDQFRFREIEGHLDSYMYKDQTRIKMLNERLNSSAINGKFKCDVCQKCFTTKSSLKEHFITHIDYRPFMCKFCTAGFKRRQALQRHLKAQHSTERPFHCDECCKPFSRRGDFIISS